MSFVEEMARQARRAGRQLARLGASQRSRLLDDLAAALADDDARTQLLAANGRDVEAGRVAAARGELSEAVVRRLVLDESKLDGLCDGLRQLAGQPEIVGQRQVYRELDEGLTLRRVSCPLGLLGVIFESRPDAVPQISGLAIKSGNAVLLKGGREAAHSNRALVDLLRAVLVRHQIEPTAIGLLEDRAQVNEMLGLRKLIDLVIARGSSAFVHHIQSHSDIPVMGHAEGLCHLYLDATADPTMAARIAVDAKTSYPAACNAIETLLWHPDAGAALDASVAALQAAGVELRACQATRERHGTLLAATDEDWSTEYTALILSIRRVDDLDQALEHIERFGSGHTEVILTADATHAERFLAEVDAAGVFHNASSRFADGYRYGLGAEVGISTGKMHARGPVGVEGLLTYRWLLTGGGHVAGDYGPGKRRFTHRDL